jgi:3-oxoadipate enol-lactonase
LLHHGYCRNMHFWRNWVPLLSNNYRVLRISGRGCGGTTVPPPEEPYTMDRLVADAIGVMDALSIPRVIWIGESSGGILGLATALQNPKRISALVLCDTPFKITNSVATAYNLGESDYSTTIKKLGFREWCKQTLQYRVDPNRASTELQQWYVDQMGSASEHIAISHHMMAVESDIWPRIAEIALPTLIMVGAKSKLAIGDKMIEMRAYLPNAKLVSFEDYGHGINLLAPELCCSEVHKFLQSR